MHSNPNIDYECLEYSNNPPQARKWLCNVKGCRRRFKNRRHWVQHFMASHYIDIDHSNSNDSSRKEVINKIYG